MTDIDPLVVRPTPRRATPPSQPQRRRRRHPATGARIVAAGLGASTLFGLVATMGIAQVRAESTPSSTGATLAPVSPITPTAPLTIVPVAVLTPTPASAPVGAIVLQARPDVRVVTPAAAAAPAPVATTSGSN